MEQTTRSISADIAAFFDKIRSQAREYTALMEQLHEVGDRIEEQSVRIEEEMDQLRRSSRKTAAKLDAAVAKNLEAIEQKSVAINRVYGELNAIEETKKSLQAMHDTAEQQQRDVDQVLTSMEARIKNATESVVRDIESKLAVQLLQVKEEVRTFDQRLVKVMDLARRESRMNQEDIDNFKSKIPDTKLVVEEAKKLIEDYLLDAEKNVDSKVIEARKELERAKNEAVLDEERREAGENKELAELRTKNAELRNRLQKVESGAASMRTMLLATAIGSILAAAVVAILLK